MRKVNRMPPEKADPKWRPKNNSGKHWAIEELKLARAEIKHLQETLALKDEFLQVRNERIQDLVAYNALIKTNQGATQ